MIQGGKIFTMLLLTGLCGFANAAGSKNATAAADVGFSWDTVPKFLYLSGKNQFTADELDYIAQNFYWVTFAIGFGGADHKTYDDALGYAARELKQRNPRIKVLYYWNASRVIHNYGTLNRQFAEHPDWDIAKGALGFAKDGTPLRLQNGKDNPELNVANPEARQWWLDNAFRALELPFIDGVWVDAAARIYNPGARRTLERGGMWEETEKGLLQMYDELAKHYRKNNGIVMGNFLREHDDTPYEKLWPYFDGSFIENHYNLVGEKSCTDEYRKNIESIIEKTREAAKKGKIIGFYAGGASDPIYDSNRYSLEERKEKLARHFEYNLALYLILAEEGVYFEYNDGFRSDVHVWNVEYPEYSYKLGAPNGNAVKRGNVYRREFAHASVVLDIEKREADIVWK